jgi:hypothetical protein
MPNALCLFLLVLAVPSSLGAWGDWQTLNTPRFRVFYKPGYEPDARQALAVLEYYRKNVATLTGNPMGRVPFVIEDIGTMSNGYTDPLYGNIHLFTYPPEAPSEIGFAQNWWREVAVHEYIHMGHLTNSSELPRVLVALLGSPLHPNILSPGWITEGITVYGESQLSPYEGRLNDGFFDAYIASRAAEYRLPSLADATYLPLEYPYLTGSYLYGGEFFSYLGQTYGSDRFASLFRNTGSSILTYCSPCCPILGLDPAASSEFRSRSFPSLFDDWRYRELERNRTWRMDGERLTWQGGTVSYLTLGDEKLYYVRDRITKTGAARAYSFTDIVELKGDTIPHRVPFSLDSALRPLFTERVVVSLTTSVTCPLRIEGEWLYYAAADLEPGYANAYNLGFGYVSNLHKRNLRSGQDDVILRDRFRCFAVLPDGRILYARDRQGRFGSQLLVLSTSSLATMLFDTDYLVGEIATDKERIVVAARPDWENWNLYLLDLDRKDFQPIVATPWKESNLSLSQGRLLFTANYDKVYSCFAYDFGSRAFYRLTQGGFATFPAYDAAQNYLYYVGLTGAGNDVYRKPAQFAVAFTPPDTLKSEPPSLPDLGPDVRPGGYSDILPSLAPAIHIPLVLPADESLRTWQFGAYLNGADATGEHSYSALLLLPLGELAHPADRPFVRVPLGDVVYTSQFFSPVKASLEAGNSPPLGDLTLTLPVFVHPDARFSRLDVSLEAAVYDSALGHKTLIPNISTAFAFPGAELAFGAAYLGERRILGSNTDGDMIDLLASARTYLWNSEARISAEAFHGSYEVALTMPGYDRDVTAKSGIVAAAELSFPLLKLRYGLWAPSIYFEDVCGALVANLDYGLPPYRDTLPQRVASLRGFVGADLQLETGVALQGALRLIPRLGAGIAANGVPVIYAGVDVGSWLLSGRSPERKVINSITGKSRMDRFRRLPAELYRKEFRL